MEKLKIREMLEKAYEGENVSEEALDEHVTTYYTLVKDVENSIKLYTLYGAYTDSLKNKMESFRARLEARLLWTTYGTFLTSMGDRNMKETRKAARRLKAFNKLYRVTQIRMFDILRNDEKLNNLRIFI